MMISFFVLALQALIALSMVVLTLGQAQANPMVDQSMFKQPKIQMSTSVQGPRMQSVKVRRPERAPVQPYGSYNIHKRNGQGAWEHPVRPAQVDERPY